MTKREIINQHKGKTLNIVNGYSVIECKHCKFKHIFPYPTDNEIKRLYEEEFYSKEKPRYFKDAEEDFDWWMQTYTNYYNIFKKYTDGRKILDIGSGPGYLLKCGKDLGWKVLGIEPSQYAYQYSKKLGVDVIHGFYSENIIFQYGKFDVVHLSLVLEHILNPKYFLTSLKNILNPSGIICIICPNDYNPLQDILYKYQNFNPYWISPLHHINYFNFLSLKQLVESVGFDVVDTYGTFPMELFLLSGDDYTTDPAIGRMCHSKRKSFEENLYTHNPKLLNSIYSSLAQYDIGRECVIIGRIKNPF